MKVSLDRARKRIALLWFLLSGVSFLLVLALTVTGFYGSEFGWVWNWFLPTVVPSLSLVVGVLVAEAFRSDKRPQTVDKFLYRMAWWFSLAYLLLVLGMLLAQPVVTITPHALLADSHLWLVPLQGLVSASLGAFFVRSEVGK